MSLSAPKITLSDIENYNLHDELIHYNIIPYLTPYDKYLLFYEYIKTRFSNIVNMRDFKEKLKVIFTCVVDFNTFELLKDSAILSIDSEIQLIRHPETKKKKGCSTYVLMCEPDCDFVDFRHESTTYFVMYDKFLLWKKRALFYNIVLYGFNNVIDSTDMVGLIGLRCIYFRGMTSVKTIKNNFLANSLCRYVKFTGLHNVTSIGDNFMSECNYVKTVTFNGLTNVKSIGDGWLYDCEHLENVSFKGLTNLTSIGDNFMADCFIKTVTFNGLTNVKSIGNYWLRNCVYLANISFEGLTNLTSIGTNVMNCIGTARNLTHVGVSGIKNLANVNDLLDDDTFMHNAYEPLRNEIIRRIAAELHK